MRSANLFGPLKGLCPHKALIGLTQASGLAGGFDLPDHTGAQESWSTPLRYSLGDTPMTSRKARANLLALS